MEEAKSTSKIIESMKNNLNKNSMVTESNGITAYRPKRLISSDFAEFKADKLVEKYNAPQSRKFFLKCVYHLSESDIEDAVELSMQPWVKSPIKYFVRICSSKFDK